MTTATKADWRKTPPSWTYEMVQDDDSFPTIFPATPAYNADRARMAEGLGCFYIEVRMETFWAVWDPADAERRYREDYDVPPERVLDLNDFWTESGTYCPWRTVKRGTPGGVKFRRGEVA